MDQPRNRNWIWFFIAVGVLGAIAATIPLVYNLRQQLTLPMLQAARERWRQNGPKSYILEYSKHGNASGILVATVRDGKIQSVISKASPEDPGRPVEPRQLGYYDMIGLMEDIERFLEMDAQPGAARAYNHALFADDGHLIRYVRHVAADNFRLEIRVQRLEPLP